MLSAPPAHYARYTFEAGSKPVFVQTRTATAFNGQISAAGTSGLSPTAARQPWVGPGIGITHEVAHEPCETFTCGNRGRLASKAFASATRETVMLRPQPDRLRRALGFLLGFGLVAALLAAPATTAEALSTKDELLTAKVPSMCDNPAGTLVGGELPNIPGWVAIDLEKSTLGNLVKGGGRGAVATFHCSAGGIGWADHVVFYDSNGGIIGHFDTGKLGIGGSSRASISNISIKSRTVTVRVIGVPRAGDLDLWGSTGTKLTFAYNKKTHRVARRTTQYYTEKSTGKRLLSLVRAGRTKAARKIASASVVKQLRSLVKQENRPKGVRVSLGQCGGPEMWGRDYYWFISRFDPGDRGCIYNIVWGPSGNASADLIVFQHPAGDTNWTKWYGHRYAGVAG